MMTGDWLAGLSRGLRIAVLLLPLLAARGGAESWDGGPENVEPIAAQAKHPTAPGPADLPAEAGWWLARDDVQSDGTERRTRRLVHANLTRRALCRALVPPPVRRRTDVANPRRAEHPAPPRLAPRAPPATC